MHSKKNNKDIVLKAIKQNGWALGYASKELQNDEEVFLKAVQQDRPSLNDLVYIGNWYNVNRDDNVYNNTTKIKKEEAKIKKEEIEIPDEEIEESIKEEDNINEEYICLICSDKKINTVILDCKHSKMCISCSRKIMLEDNKINKDAQCPVCRTHIKKGIIKIF